MKMTILGTALYAAMVFTPGAVAIDYANLQDQKKHESQPTMHDKMMGNMPAMMEKMRKMRSRMETLINEMPDSPRKVEMMALHQEMKKMREHMMHKMPATKDSKKKQEHKH